MSSATRSRDLTKKVTSGITYLGDGSVFAGPDKWVYPGRQFTVSEGHRRSRDGKYHEGGDFFTYRVTPSITTMGVSLRGSSGQKYDGPSVVPGISSPAGSGNTSPDSSHLDQVGATAIKLVDPTDPNANTGVALGEILKDKRIPIPGIPTWRRRTELAKAAGSEYLNAVFGWLPLISDMKDTAQSVLDGNTILENYRAASGTLVHREFAFPDNTTTSEAVVSTTGRMVYPGNIPSFNGPGQVVTRKRVTTVKRWFSGSFTYYANGGSSSITKCMGIGSEAEKLFGVTLTPDLIWELTPWSWAIDWFSNAGDVLSNVNSFKLAGLVMKYGYIMEETSTVDTYHMPATGLKNVSGKPPASGYSIVTKRRKGANPFGFGVSWDGLSPTQLAITAALGITRLR